MNIDLSLQLGVRKAIVERLKGKPCNTCRREFLINSITLVNYIPGAVVATIQCKHCGSKYGTAVVGYRDSEDE